MKLGVDVHGVITKDPDFFAELSARLCLFGHEVHVLTGVEDGDRIRKKLSMLGITYTHFFSITTYHKELGTPIKYKDGDLTQPLIAPPKWDRTKADYCKRAGIDIHIDDSSVYGRYFEDFGVDTQYLLYNDNVRDFLATLMRRRN